MMFDVYSEINVRYILKYFMYVPVVTTNNQLFSRNLISHQALIPPPFLLLQWKWIFILRDFSEIDQIIILTSVTKVSSGVISKLIKFCVWKSKIKRWIYSLCKNTIVLIIWNTLIFGVFYFLLCPFSWNGWVASHYLVKSPNMVFLAYCVTIHTYNIL